jgi:DNA repair exonuclease SbcCD nuclease subunit
MIVLGDFGLVWSNSKEEIYWQNWLNTRNYTTLFVDGNHENFNLLNAYPVTEWNGGKVHMISDSIIHLMRGQVFTLNGEKFFTMGGGTSIDKHYRIEGKSWWAEEIPSSSEFEEGMDNLDKHNWEVDYVLSHTTSKRIMELICYIKENNPINTFFDMLEKDLTYKYWFFGHFHEDLNIDEKHCLLFDSILDLSKVKK